MSKATLSTGSNSKYSYATIVGGLFHVKVNEDTPDAVKRTNKLGTIVHELQFNELFDFILHNLDVENSDYGQQLKITLKDTDNDNFFVVQCPLNSGYAYSFLNRIDAIDLSKPITLKVFDIENTGEDNKTYKTKSITISQDGKLLNKSWTSENNPVPKSILLKDKKGKPVMNNGFNQYDNSEREVFLADYCNKYTIKLIEANKNIKPQLNSVNDVDSEDLAF